MRILSILLLLAACGCTNSNLVGGSSRHATNSADSFAATQPSVTVTGRRDHRQSGQVTLHLIAAGADITITDSRDRQATSQPTTVIMGGQQRRNINKADDVATTQPSVSVTGDAAKVSAGAAGDGELGSLTFDVKQMKNTPTAWGLIGLLLAGGAGFYFVKNWAGMILCGAGVVLAFVYPAALVWIALAAIGWLILANRSAIAQLIAGAQNAINVLPAADAQTVKTELEKAQAPNVKSIVKSVQKWL